MPKTMVVMRGLPGSGKSYLLKKYKVLDFVLSMDTIRLMLSAPKKDETGAYQIDQSYNAQVAKFFNIMLKMRLENGSFTILDNTNLHHLQSLKNKADAFGYKMVIIDFTSLPVETVKTRNSQRISEYRRVPVDVIDNMEKKISDIPEGVEVILPDDTQKLRKLFNKANMLD